MKVLVNIARIIVGVLFIVSGLVKVNDPLGLSYKMEEFFNVWGVSFLNEFSLWLSVAVIALEIIAGAALLLGWKIKQVSWLLLVLVVFFTILTGYAYLSGKIKSCGCFGDCLPLKAGQSFLKDVILLVLILFLVRYQRYIRPLFSKTVTLMMMILVSLFSFASQWYTLNYLPVVDCLPFKKGGSIPLLMTIPNNAIPDQTEITFVYEKDGKEVEFGADKFPADFNETTYKFLRRYDRVLKEGSNNEPPIKGFLLVDAAGQDHTHEILGMQEVMLLFMEDLSRPPAQWKESFKGFYDMALHEQLPIYVVTSGIAGAQKAFVEAGFDKVNVLGGDRTMIRTAARVNPTVIYLKNGIIGNKWSYKNFDKAQETITREKSEGVKIIETTPPPPARSDTLTI